MNRLLVLLGALFIGVCVVVAKPSATHYAILDGKSGSTLFNALSECAGKGYHSLGYDGLYTAYPKTDSRNGKIWDMYSDCEFDYSDKCGNYSRECDCYNREHSVPKSWWGGGTSNQGCDIFILLPTDGYVNGRRSNYPLGEVGADATYVSHNGSKVGNSALSGYSDKVFEPIDEYKGDFARGVLGAMVKWKGSWTQGNGSSTFNGKYTSADNYGLTPYGVALLMKWHRQDPVSQKELDRNDAIEQTQGNRNPFIDYPCLAEYLWGERKDRTVELGTLMSAYDDAYPDSDHTGCDCVPLTSPVLTSPRAGTEINFGEVETDTEATGFFTLKGALLTQSLSLSLSGQDMEAFRVSPSFVTAQQALSGQQVAVVFRPQEARVYTAELTVTTPECSSVTLTLTGRGKTAGQGGGGIAVGNGDYVKLTEAPADFAGTYLFVYEAESVCFNGALEEADLAKTGNIVTVTIDANTIASTSATDAAALYVEAVSGGYAVRTASGYYIGCAESRNTVNASATEAYVNTLALSNGNATLMSSNGRTLRYNTSAHCFRYYASGQEPFALYRKTLKVPTAQELVAEDTLAVVRNVGGVLVVTAVEPVAVAVFDMLGRMIINDSHITELRQALPQGIYLVRINGSAQWVMIR